MFSGSASNSEFESCMNDLLEDSYSSSIYCEDKSNHEILEDIRRLRNIQDLKPCHIDYIEDKLKKIAIINLSDAHSCMVALNLSESLCEQPVSTKMLQIAYLIFHIIGLDNIDLQSIREGTSEYYTLTTIIDRLTPFIKYAVRRIIDISKHYEETTCGHESTTTHVLDRMYVDMFENTKEVSIDLNALNFIPDYLIREINTEGFIRSVVLMMILLYFAYLLFGRVSVKLT